MMATSLLLFVWVVLGTGCATRDPLLLDLYDQEQMQTPTQDLDWNLFTINGPTRVPPAGSDKHFRLIQRDPSLANLAAHYFMENPETLGFGVIEKQGTEMIYAVPRAKLANHHYLYWDMVRILSEKYGCLMIRRSTTTAKYVFHCRDTRRIEMNIHEQPEHIYLSTSQYDKYGRRAIVKNRKIIALE